MDLNGDDTRSTGGRYGQCCPNNAEYRAFTEEQIKELCEYFLHDITINVVCPEEPKSVTLVDSDLPLLFTWQDGMCTVQFEKIHCFEMFAIDW